MPRPPRIDVSGYVYHVLNRANARWRIFRREGDFEAFERILEEAVERDEGEIELFAYIVMPNHWHMVLRSDEDGAVGRFMKWLTTTHAGRYRVAHGSVGLGHLYQGRYKSFLVEGESYFVQVCRYVERNALRANLVPSGRAEDWRWSSLWRWRYGSAEARSLLSPWPVPGGRRPKNWLARVNEPETETELIALRRAVNRCSPYGSEAWRERVVKRFGLQSTIRNPGRPKNGV